MAYESVATEKLVELLRQLLETEILREGRVIFAHESPEWWKARAVVAAVRGLLRCGEADVAVRIGLSDEFPVALPEIAVDDEARVGLPHIEADGKLCYARDANLVDRHDLPTVLDECVELARATLQTVLEGDRSAEYAQEIHAYWSRLANEKVEALVAPTGSPRLITALVDRGVVVAVADDPAAYGLSIARRSTEQLTFENAVYIPIAPASEGRQFAPKDLLDVDRLRILISDLDDAAQAELRAALTRCRKRQELVVLGVDRPRDERALIAIRMRGISGVRGEHPLLDRDSKPLVSAVAVSRRDREYLTNRGGASPARKKMRVLLVGCGAVGGHVAIALARAGVGQLSLVDHDLFTMENAFRHAVGMRFIHRPKVVGMKQYLEETVPFVRVGAYPMKFQKLLAQWPQTVSDHDLIISATGHPTLDLEINAQLWTGTEHTPGLFGWLEPLGLGGHVVCTRVPPVNDESPIAPGCLECLYTRPVLGGGLVNDAAFADPSRHYTRDVLGCGSAFLPFNDLDAGRTAEVTARIALEVLDGVRTCGALVSWKGSPRALRKAGYATTPRFDDPTADGVIDAASFCRPDCRICGGGA